MLQVSFRKVHPGKVDRLRWWMSELMRRRNEVIETFQNEGTYHEMAYLLHTADGPVLVYAIESEDLERGRQAYHASTLRIDLEHRGVMKEVVAGRVEAELLYDVRI